MKFSTSANSVKRDLLVTNAGSSCEKWRSTFVTHFEVKALRGAIIPRYLSSPLEVMKLSTCEAIVVFWYCTLGSFTPVGT